MFVQFLTPTGNPVYLRPETVEVLSGYLTSRDGRPERTTRIVLGNRAVVFVRGDVDAIKAAIEAAVVAPAAWLGVMSDEGAGAPNWMPLGHSTGLAADPAQSGGPSDDQSGVPL